MARRSIAWLLVATTTALPAFAPSALARGHRGSSRGGGGHHQRYMHDHSPDDGGDGWELLALGLAVDVIGAALSALPRPHYRPKRRPPPARYVPLTPVSVQPPAPAYVPSVSSTPLSSPAPLPPLPPPPPPAPVACDTRPSPAAHPIDVTDCVNIETPILEDRVIPIYEDRIVPMTEIVVTPVIARRLHAASGRMRDVVIGERRTPTVVGTRVERVQVGERRVTVRTGTRVERRCAGAFPPRNVGAPTVPPLAPPACRPSP